MTARRQGQLTWRTYGARILAALLIPLALAACAKAPATGDRIFTGGMSLADERQIGAEEHPKLVTQFGGEFDEQAITAYVTDIGQRLAQHSELPGLDWNFTVIDSPIVNAFALPGGYVHVTRGLVALAENEAELAGVLAHEIGHVTARHSAERYGSSVLANVAGIASAVLLGREAANAVSTLSGVALQSYSRGQELEADTLAVRYLRRAGYDPDAMASFLRKMRANSQLQAVLAGQPEEAADSFDIMQTHPRTLDRIEQAIKAAQNGPVNGELGREAFLQRIDGMRYGDSPSQGFIRGPAFLHPEMRFAFEVPSEFRLINQPSQVVALGPDGATIVFNTVRTERPMGADTFMRNLWAKNVSLRQFERIQVDGKDAATGAARIRTKSGTRDFRLVAVRWTETVFYRLMFVTHPSQTDRFLRDFQRTTYSLRELSREEASKLEPLRLYVHSVTPGESVSGLAAMMPLQGYLERRFRVLNGLDEGDGVQAGEKVKVVREGA